MASISVLLSSLPQLGILLVCLGSDHEIVISNEWLEFQFYPLNHSVARASFGVTPCIPYEYSSNKTGFFSGFQPVNLTLESQLPTWSVTVNDTEPIFYYCGAPSSCQSGMIGVINPVSFQLQSFCNRSNSISRILRSHSPNNSPGQKTLISNFLLASLIRQKVIYSLLHE
jgi:hypothetical protein